MFPLKIFEVLETTKRKFWARRREERNSLWFFALSEKIPKKSKIHEFKYLKIEITRIKSVFSFGSVFFGRAKKMNKYVDYKLIRWVLVKSP